MKIPSITCAKIVTDVACAARPANGPVPGYQRRAGGCWTLDIDAGGVGKPAAILEQCTQFRQPGTVEWRIQKNHIKSTRRTAQTGVRSGQQRLAGAFFKNLLHLDWIQKKWDGPVQYVDKDTEELMMLPTDLCLKTDPNFR